MVIFVPTFRIFLNKNKPNRIINLKLNNDEKVFDDYRNGCLQYDADDIV